MGNLFQTIQLLRSRIPTFECLPGCHDCCGPVLATAAEVRFLPRIENEVRQVALDEYNCVHLGEDGCQVYADRPLICRLFGTTQKLSCPRGARPKTDVCEPVERAVFSILANQSLRLI